jgi:hypothetical protein
MKPLLPKGWNPPPVRQTSRFTPVFRREPSPAMITHLMRHAYGWTTDDWSWPADPDARLQKPWQCASWAAVNAFKAFCQANGRGSWYDYLAPETVHGDAQGIDGLEGGAAEVATTIEAAMEALCELANAGLREPWVYWSPVSVDVTGAWQKSVSPVVADLRWPSGWEGYSFIWKTLLWTHEHDPKGRHAVALMGHQEKKRAGLFRAPVRAFRLQDSTKGEMIWIDVAAMARHWVGGAGFILASQWEKLKEEERKEPTPAPMA